MRSEDAEARADLFVHPIDLTIEHADTYRAGETAEVRFVASSSYGVLPDFRIDVNAARGSLSERRLTVADNVVSTTIQADGVPGPGKVYAAFADRLFQSDFLVEDPIEIAFGSRVLISDVDGPGTLAIEDELVPYTDRSVIELSGQPGERIDLSLESSSVPPLDPVLSYAMDSSPSATGEVVDSVRGTVAVARDVSLADDTAQEGSGGFAFSSASALELGNAAVGVVREVGFTFEVRPTPLELAARARQDTAESHLLRVPSHGLNVYWDDGSIVAEQTGIEGSEDAIVRTGTLESRTWHSVAIHLQGGRLRLIADGKTVETPLVSTSVDTPLSFVVGSETDAADGFDGTVSDLNVFDWSSARRAQFASGGRTSVTLDENGRGQATLFASGGNGRTTEAEALQAAAECTVRPGSEEGLDEYDEGFLTQAEAFTRSIADCKVLPKIKRLFIEVQTANDVFTTGVAVTELSGPPPLS